MLRLNISQSIGDICSRYENINSNNTVDNKWSIITNDNRIGNDLRKSNSEVICKRGLKPSDRHDPQKRRLLDTLTTKFWNKFTPSHQSENNLSVRTDFQESSKTNEKKIDLKKLFTPATDFEDHYICPHTHKKMYASSSFYSPNHPTVEEQLELARRISRSLSDISNQRSKGQSMYVNRKKRSVKWVHEGEGKGAPLEEQSSVMEEKEIGTKKTLKLVMNPKGHVQDLQSLRRLGYNIEPGALSPEICFDLVKDMQATKGKGAELFAKRRKKSEKWVIESNADVDVKKNDEIRRTDWKSNLADERRNSSEISRNQQERFDCNGKQMALYSSRSTNERHYNQSNGNDFSKFKFTEELYKPKIPRAWNSSHDKQSYHYQQTVYDKSNRNSNNAETKMTNSLPRNFLYFGSNNYNTAARGWQPSMQYYRPVTFHQKRLSYTDF